MKTLVVDDQLVSRAKMEKILGGLGECVAVGAGESAIEAYQKAWEDSAPFDLITLDVSMPGLDGTGVLQALRELERRANVTEEKRVKILMVTSCSDKATVIACLQAGCDDYIVKPISRAVITKKIKDFGFDCTVSNDIKDEKSVGEMVSGTIEGFKKGNIELPVLPHIVQELQDVMNKPTATATEVAHVVEKDAAISVKLISTANSPLYRGTQKTDNVGMAISRIGLKETQSVASAIANKGLYKTKSPQLKELMDKLWLHSLACAHCAKAISKKVLPGYAEKVFVKGLIHDVGGTLLLKSLGDTADKDTQFDTADLVNSLYEVHTSFGAALLERWAFSEDFVNIAKLHEWVEFPPETGKEVLIVNLADNLAHKIGYGFFDKDVSDLSDLQSTELLKIDPAILDGIGEEVKGVIEESSDGVS